MKNYSTIFRQILRFLPKRQFAYDAQKGGYNRYTKHFYVWRQFIVNLYAQISGKKSLRDIETGLRAQQDLWHHLGLKNISKSQLSYVNGKRDYRIFQNLYYNLFSKCIDVTPKHKFRFKNPLQILDSTLIDLCLSVFPWAKFRKQKGALKIHALLDVKGNIPSFMVVSTGKDHDIKVARQSQLPLYQDSITVMDRAYIDYAWLYSLNSRGVFFVTRAKDNIDYDIIGQHADVKNKKIMSDLIIKLRGPKSANDYPEKLRLVEYWDEDGDDDIMYFLTNNFHLSAATIAEIYKARWQIEIFFKWIKQNLKIKTFLGTSKNAVMTQIWTAMIYYLLLSYIRYQTKYAHSLLNFTRLFKETLFKKMDIIDLLSLNVNTIKKARDPCYQRVLFDLDIFY